ncbi:HIRAN domain-containing protein [Neomicrococcus aestuarii]|uniref:HIRAN domain-containing protein n=1 Tax=Neomicrococcus aestuarii TaxID=556325 RepID=UPI0018DECCEF|nr:HIRAN domain-containing protein [Neomicrococcus aestuarii]
MSLISTQSEALNDSRHIDSLLVTWQHPLSRKYFLAGVLGRDPSGIYTFSYYPQVSDARDFRPIPGFDNLEKNYQSRTLFPVFSTRVMSLKRPDRHDWLRSLGLTEEATEFEILGRSLGRRIADTIEVYPEPIVDFARKSIEAEVPIHGLRYHPEGVGYVDSGRLQEGDTVEIRNEPENAHDSRAQAVFTVEGVKLGYIPAPVLDYLSQCTDRKLSASGTVVHVNSALAEQHQKITLNVVWAY